MATDFDRSELFWSIVSLWDPDWWGVYTGDLRDLADIDRAAFVRSQESIEAELSGLPDEAVEGLRPEVVQEPLADPSMPAPLQELLVARGAPLNHSGRMVQHGPITGAEPPYPLVDVLQFTELPAEVLDLQPGEEPIVRLMVAAELGLLSSTTRAQLPRPGVSMRDVVATSRDEALRWVFGNRPDGVAPFALAELGLTWFGPRTNEESTVVLVAGDSPWDFALAYALRRAIGRAFWMPAAVFDVGPARLSAIQHALRFAERAGMPLVVTTASDEGAASQLAGEVGRMARRSLVVRLTEWRETLPLRPNRLLASDIAGMPESVYLHDGWTPWLATPIPPVRTAIPTDQRWMTEVHVLDWSAVRHPTLGPELLPPSMESRTTADGIAYSCPSIMVRSGVPIEHQTRRPRVAPLDLLGQLQILAAKAGWQCAPSEKGLFAAGAMRLFGGFGDLGAALRDPDVVTVLTTYGDGDRKAPGLALKDRRRYLSLADLTSLGLTRGAQVVLQELEAQEVLIRGLVLKCPRCRHADFYLPRAIDPEFACTRCDAATRPDRASWLGKPEPPWRYRLDEVVFQFVRHRGDLPVLTAFERFSGSKLPMQPIAELELKDPKGTRSEIDFAVLEGGDLWLGEAFTSDKYVDTKTAEIQRLARLSEVSRIFNARGVILATAAAGLKAATASRARATFPGPWPRLETRERAFALPRPAEPIDAGD